MKTTGALTLEDFEGKEVRQFICFLCVCVCVCVCEFVCVCGVRYELFSCKQTSRGAPFWSCGTASALWEPTLTLQKQIPTWEMHEKEKKKVPQDAESLSKYTKTVEILSQAGRKNKYAK